MNVIDKVKEIIASRSLAYKQSFGTEGVAPKIVLKDLAKFCRANETTYNPDPRIHAVLEGRREVWLRIQNYLKLTPDELWDIYRKD